MEVVTWTGDPDEIDIEARYGAAIADVGAVAFLAEVFLHLQDSTLTRWLNSLSFMWEHLPFSAWRAVMHLVVHHGPAVYQLVWSASDFLGVDMVRVIADDPEVAASVRAMTARTFQGPPRTYDGHTGEEVRRPYSELWRRMADEGAPMLYPDPGYQPNDTEGS